MKTAVITGGTKGMGKAMVEKFAKEGFSIFTCSRNKSELDALYKDLHHHYPHQTFHCLQADLSVKEEAQAFGKFVNEHGKIDVLINNTGYFIPGQIQNEDDGVLESMLNTNLSSAYHVTRALLPNMIKAKSGHIFTICSTASITAYTNGGSYCISKFALLGFNRVLREELKDKGIRVTSVLPGATKTASWDGTDLPDERFMKAQDVADAVWGVYSLSEQTVVEEILIRPQLGDIE